MSCEDPCKDAEEARLMYEQCEAIVQDPNVSQVSWRKAVGCRRCAADIIAEDAKDKGDGPAS